MRVQVGDDNCHNFLVFLDGVLQGYVVWADSDKGEIFQIDREKLENSKDPMSIGDCYVLRKGSVDIMLRSDYLGLIKEEIK